MEVQEMIGTIIDKAGIDEAIVMNRKAVDIFPANYIAQLQRLPQFVTEQESMAPAWIKDPEQLALALETLEERKDIVSRLIQILGSFSGR